MMEDRLSMLQRTPIFGGVNPETLQFLLENVTEIAVPEGDFLFMEKDPGDGMYLLETGQVAILKQWHGIYYRLNYLNAGDSIGEMSWIDLERRSASVLAMTRCRAVKLQHETILDIYERDLEQFAIIQMNTARELSRRLRVANESLFQELIKSEQVPQH